MLNTNESVTIISSKKLNKILIQLIADEQKIVADKQKKEIMIKKLKATLAIRKAIKGE